MAWISFKKMGWFHGVRTIFRIGGFVYTYIFYLVDEIYTKYVVKTRTHESASTKMVLLPTYTKKVSLKIFVVDAGFIVISPPPSFVWISRIFFVYWGIMKKVDWFSIFVGFTVIGFYILIFYMSSFG